MTTLFQATLALAKTFGRVRESKTTAAGTTTTLVCSDLSVLPEDYANGGLLWIKGGDLANKVLKVTDFAKNTGTCTFATQSAAPGSGTLFALTPMVGLDILDLISAINSALENIGQIALRDETLTTVADQQAYTLPAGVSNVKKVSVTTNDAAPYHWQDVQAWREVDDEIVLDYGYQFANAGYTIRLDYMAEHAFLDDLTDNFEDGLPLNVIKWQALFELASIQLDAKPDDKKWQANLKKAAIRGAQAKKQYRRKQLQPHHIFPDYGQISEDYS